MPRWFADNSLSIGRTPLVRLNHVSVLFEGIFDSEGMSR